MLIESLKSEIMLVENYNYRSALKAILSSISPEFLIMPAARSNHHPPDERIEGGLLLHTKRVLKTANIIIESMPEGLVDVSGIRMACLLHDAGRTINHSRHPEIMHDQIMKMEWYDPDNMPKIAKMVLRHMGRWGVELPVTKEDWIVHLADTIAAKYY